MRRTTITCIILAVQYRAYNLGVHMRRRQFRRNVPHILVDMLSATFIVHVLRSRFHNAHYNSQHIAHTYVRRTPFAYHCLFIVNTVSAGYKNSTTNVQKHVPKCRFYKCEQSDIWFGQITGRQGNVLDADELSIGQLDSVVA
jgi:hypothetical protein